MQKLFGYLFRGMFFFLAIDILSSILIAFVWNRLVCSAYIPELKFYQVLGLIIILDIFKIIEVVRSDVTKKIDGDL